MNLYKIQNTISSEAQYVLEENMCKSITYWKNLLRIEKDPEIVEWISDSIYNLKK